MLYTAVFGSTLPQKPKPFRANLILTGTLCGWFLIRRKVLDKFQFCKDIEYLYLLNLLEEVLPMAFYHYELVFRSGDLDNYIEMMLRLAILFIIWERHHYDRATLSMLSDLEHQKRNFPQYYNFKKQWFTILTEKKVEIWHSLLRYHIMAHYTAAEIRNTAITLASSKTATAFFSAFARPYKRGNSEKNMKKVSGKIAEVLLDLFKKVARNAGKSKKVSKIYV